MANTIFNIFNDKEFDRATAEFSELFNKTRARKTKKENDTGSKYSTHLVKQAINQAIEFSETEKSEDDKNSKTHVNEFDEVFGQLTVSQDRESRYAIYDELYHSVQLIKRIVKIYLSNIFSRDTITNQILSIVSTEESKDTENASRYRVFCKSVIDFFNLEYRLQRSGLNLLKFGDSFIEIIDIRNIEIERDLNRKHNKTSADLITEDYSFFKMFKTKNDTLKINDSDIGFLVDHFVDFDCYDDASLNIEERDVSYETPFDLSGITLRFHSPKNIIILTTDYDTVLGYVEIRQSKNTSIISKSSSNTLLNFAKVINQVSSRESGNAASRDTNRAIQKFVDVIVSKLLSKHKDISKFEPSVKEKIGPELFNVIQRLYLSSSDEYLFKNRLKVRFIPPTNMVQLTNPTGDFYPYGTSLIDSLVFPGKMYLLSQIANAVNKLSRSSVLRKWTIETGDVDNINALIRQLSKQIRNKNINVSDIAGSKNLPNILSDYRDLITLRKKGQSFIDVDTINTGDPNIRTQDLEDLRRELIALSGVPSMYLGYNDMDMREQVANANAVFAHDVSFIQKYVNDALTDLVARIGELVNFASYHEMKRNVRITTKAPTMLLLQQFEMSLNSISSLQRAFNEMPEVDVDPYYLLERFIPFIDWNEFQRESNDFIQKKKVKEESGVSNDSAGGFGGGY